MTPSGHPAATPREWVGDRPFPWPPAAGIEDGEDLVACYAVIDFSMGRTRSEAPFLRLRLADCYGAVERQLRIHDLAAVNVELDDLVLFLPRSARPAEHIELELTSLIDSVVDPGLRALLDSMLDPHTDTGHAFRLAPAAKQNHHAYLGGLLEHTVSIGAACAMLARHYGPIIDRDLLVTAALLHDIGKIREIGARAGFPYTDEGKLLGHIIIGLQMIAAAAARIPALAPQRLLLLQHLIASHQGRYEWQSPREPRTLEALILHYADDLDAKLNQAAALIAAVDHGWSAYDRGFGRDFFRHIPAEIPPDPEGISRSDVPAAPADRDTTPPGTRATRPTTAVDGTDRGSGVDRLGTLDLFGTGE
jgi:3'-5' exoribonuclease